MSDPDVRIAGITAPFIAMLMTGRGTEIRVGRNGIRRIRQVVNDQGLVLYHVVESEDGGERLVYDGVEAKLIRERVAFKPAKRERL